MAELEAKLGLPPKTPDDSSTPPSQGKKPSADPIASGSKGPRASHPGAHRPLHPDPTRRRDILVDQCRHCGTDVSRVAQAPFHAYDHVENPEIKPDVTRVTLHRGLCPCCGEAFRADAPADMPPGSPFGPNLRAFVIYLRFMHAISFERLARLMSDLFGLTISEGALVNMLADSRPAFARQKNLIRARLLAGSVLQSDETSVRVGKKNWWNWVFHHGEDCCFVIRNSRGKDMVADSSATSVPPCGSPTTTARGSARAKTDHQVCLAHLIRDAQYAIDAGDIAFAPGLQDLLQRACKIGRRSAARRRHPAGLPLRLNAKLDALLHIIPTHAAGEKLKAAIEACRHSLFVFLANRAVPPTNNGSEQALRPVVFEVTNCFRSEWAAHLYADIRSVIETCAPPRHRRPRRHSRNPERIAARWRRVAIDGYQKGLSVYEQTNLFSFVI